MNLQRRHLNVGQRGVLYYRLEGVVGEMAKKRQEATQCSKGVKIGDHTKAVPTLAPPNEKGKAIEIVAKRIGVGKTTLKKPENNSS